MSTARYLIGDTRDLLADVPDGSVDLIVTSPPFLALRSYLPADHPDKHREIGSEPTPADFLSTLLALTVEWRRVLAPHGSLCVELGDTYSGSGGAGGDYNEGGLRDGQEKFDGSARRGANRVTLADGRTIQGNGIGNGQERKGPGWPLAKSMCGIPTLYTWSLAYGRNLLRPEQTFAPWRIRNLLVWARPNPPVGALGDKFRPATSYITVACTSAKRWFDLDAVRTETDSTAPGGLRKGTPRGTDERRALAGERANMSGSNPAGAPPLDWHTDCDDGTHDGDQLWALPTAPYPGSHFATYPSELPARLIKAMCPMQVCRVCGEPRRRVVEKSAEYQAFRTAKLAQIASGKTSERDRAITPTGFANAGSAMDAQYETVGWTDCGHGAWRNGLTLDPFCGSGTTLAAATGAGRDALGFDLDPRNLDLARERVGMFLEAS